MTARGIGEVERHQRDLRQRRKPIEPGRFLPRLGITGPNQIGAGFDDCFDERLPHRRLGVRDQNLAEFWIAGHFTKLAVVGHVRGVLLRHCDQRRLAGAVDVGMDANPRRRTRAIAVQMRDHDWTAIEPDHAEPPRHALAIEQLIAVVQRRFRNQLARAVLRLSIRADATGRRGRLRAADIAPRRNRGRFAARGGRAPRPR